MQTRSNKGKAQAGSNEKRSRDVGASSSGAKRTCASKKSKKSKEPGSIDLPEEGVVEVDNDNEECMEAAVKKRIETRLPTLFAEMTAVRCKQADPVFSLPTMS